MADERVGPDLVEFGRVTVTRIVLREGRGIDREDPIRHVTYWIEDDGALVCRHDPWTDGARDEGYA